MKRKYYTIHGDSTANSVNNATVLPSISNTISKKLNYPRNRIVGKINSISGPTNNSNKNYIDTIKKQVVSCEGNSVFSGNGPDISITNGEYIDNFITKTC